jgi:excisionase family DNA binding protein
MQTPRTSQPDFYTAAQDVRSDCEDLLTVGEVAELLNVPISWVYERTRRRGIERIPHFKLGKYLRFARTEILQWVQRQR